MLQREEREREILLGNGQLLGIFFVVAALLGIAFFGGYKVGRYTAAKTNSPAAEAAASLPAVPPDTAPAATRPGGETHSVSPEETVAQDASASQKTHQDLLGARRKKTTKADEPPTPSSIFVPQSGQEFLQVAAVPRDHAFAVASVLRKKGFAAHAVAKPGDASIYRVIVGPLHSPGELSSTRDSLRKTGFSQVIVQHF